MNSVITDMATGTYSEFHKLAELIQQKAVPDGRDRECAEAVYYTNIALRHFGQERCLLSGSTSEGTKLHTKRQHGDADFMLISGIGIKHELLEYREDSPCYLRIHGQSLNHGLDVQLVDGKYLPASLLRDFSTKAFKMLRVAVDLLMKPRDIPGRNERWMDIGKPSNVGIEMNYLTAVSPKFPQSDIKQAKATKDDLRTALNSQRERVEQTEPNEEVRKLTNTLCSASEIFTQFIDPQNDSDSYRLNKFFSGFFHSGEMSDHSSGTKQATLDIHLQAGAERAHSLTGSQKVRLGSIDSSDNDTISNLKPEEDVNTSDVDILYNRKDSMRSDPMCSSKPNVEEGLLTETNEVFKIKCGGEKSIDFVPAFPIIGKPTFWFDWVNRERKWPSQQTVQDISEMELFLVAKAAPVDPCPESDFRLSFSAAESKLFDSVTPVQKKCYLVLKVCNKNLPQQQQLLTSYHWKTAFFWVSESWEPSNWTDDKLLAAVKMVIQFMITSLRTHRLQHYFVPANLFAGASDSDMNDVMILLETIVIDPVQCLHLFCHDSYIVDTSKEVSVSKEALEALHRISDAEGSDVTNVSSIVEYVRRSLLPSATGETEKGAVNSSRQRAEVNANKSVTNAVISTLGDFLTNTLIDQVKHKDSREVHSAFDELNTVMDEVTEYLQDDNPDMATKREALDKISTDIFKLWSWL